MPSLADHQSNDFTKLLLIGDSKSGKTGSLVSLVKAGYKLRILDTDNLLDVLKYMVQKECPDKIGNVEFRSLRDNYKVGPVGVVVDGKPTAWLNALRMLIHWKYDDVDLGAPHEWGPDCVLVVDSLSRLCDAAFAFHDSISKNPDRRSVFFDAQNDVEKCIAELTSDNMRTNVIVIAHVQYIDQADGTRKGYPQGVGSALSPKIPQYFGSVVLYTKKGDKRTLQTNSTPMVDLANPKPFAMQPSYPIETGLADFFSVLREPPKATVTQQQEPNANERSNSPQLLRPSQHLR